MIVIFRLSGDTGRVFISLVVHPLSKAKLFVFYLFYLFFVILIVVEFILTITKFSSGSRETDHAFYDHLDIPLLGIYFFSLFFFHPFLK